MNGEPRDDIVLAVAHLNKTFGSAQVLREVSLELSRGEILGLIGANGAGKSTLVSVLAGVIAPNRGSEITLGGVRVAFHSPHDALAAGIVIDPQEFELIGEQSVAENLSIGALPTRFPGIVDRGRVMRDARELLSRVGLAELDPARPAAQLTSVEARLVSIAKALSRRPRVLILDEPSAALPTDAAERLGPILRGLAADGASIVYVSHRLGEIQEFCDRIIAMRDGQVAGELNREQVTRQALIELIGGQTGDLEPRPLERSESHDETVIQARGLCGTKIRDVDFDVGRGEIVGIGGLFGSGRSELLRLLCGLQQTSGGELEILEGEAPKSVREAATRGVAYLAERRADMVFPTMSVLENCAIASFRQTGRVVVRGSRAREQVRPLLREMHIVGALDADMRTLSGGNQQKVLLARWLLRSPRILLLDEPTAGVDVVARAEIHRLLKELAGRGHTIVLASAEPEELVLLCDRVIVLVDGRVGDELAAPFDANRLIIASYAASPVAS
jgi:ribose transport system ATP-binding protein